MRSTQVAVPDIGDFGEVPVIEILVSVGDTVAAEDPLVTLESDKATMDVPAPFAGVVREIGVQVGDRVSQGSALMTIEAGGDAAESAEPSEITEPAAPAQEAEPAEDAEQPAAGSARDEAAPAEDAEQSEAGSARDEAAPAERAGPNGVSPIYASPSARRVAREHGIDLRTVAGSGRGGRITREDVQRLADGAGAAGAGAAGDGTAGGGAGLSLPGLPPWPSIDFEKLGPVERVQRSRIQRISAPNLARNWAMIPHVTHNDEADITELEAWRRRLNDEHSDDGVKFTMVSFLVAACVATLKQFPTFNSSLDGDELVLKRYWNIGFAADTPGGLVVPVIRDADSKGLREIAVELAELSNSARAGKLSPAQMSGSTFTISSLGGIGGTSFTPIVNAPEVAILGVTRAAMKPVWDGSTFAPRLMLPLSLSYDHRVIDGAAAARFVVHLVGVLSDMRRALL